MNPTPSEEYPDLVAVLRNFANRVEVTLDLAIARLSNQPSDSRSRIPKIPLLAEGGLVMESPLTLVGDSRDGCAIPKHGRCLQRKESRELDGLGWCQLPAGHLGNCDADFVETRELSDAERAEVARFGLDRPMSLDELAERVALRAGDIADRAASLRCAVEGSDLVPDEEPVFERQPHSRRELGVFPVSPVTREALAWAIVRHRWVERQLTGEPAFEDMRICLPMADALMSFLSVSPPAEVEPRTVNTVEELEALPDGAVVLNGGDVFQYRGKVWCTYESARFISSWLFKHCSPLKVLWVPVSPESEGKK